MEESVKCPMCNGDGWTTEHANHPHPDGDCCGACPIQEQCEYCRATGRMTAQMMKENLSPKPKTTDNGLPF